MLGALWTDTGLEDLIAVTFVPIGARLALVPYVANPVMLKRDQHAAAVMDHGKTAFGAWKRFFELRRLAVVHEEHFVVFYTFDDRRAGAGQ